jgi:hypothetical protein
MTITEIEHMWKVASNDPNHDYNWNDTVVIAFAKLVAQHERSACAKICNEFCYGSTKILVEKAIQARGQA